MTTIDRRSAGVRVPVGNRIVAAILRSPARRLLARSTVLLRYQGRRTGRTVTTPTQYAWCGGSLVVAVARPESKTWWRNFESDHPLDVLIDGEWTTMTGRAFDTSTDPEAATPLLDAYLARFPKAEAHLAQPGGPVILVRCRPC